MLYYSSLMILTKKAFNLLVIVFTLFALAVVSLPFAAPGIVDAQGCSADLEGKSDAELERMLADCEAEIAAENAKLAETQRTATSLEAGIAEFDYKIRMAQLEIKRRNIEIARLGDEITVRNDHIDVLSAKTERIKESLAELIRKSNELGSFSAVEAVLSGDQLSDFFINLDDFEVVKTGLQTKLTEVRQVKELTEEEKVALQEKEEEERSARYLRQKEKDQEENLKNEKERILALTREEEKSYKEVIAEKERIKNEIRNRVFKNSWWARADFRGSFAFGASD